MLLELALAEERPGRLRPRPLAGADRPYRRHFLDLGGLGVRDLLRDGDDLLVLAGPTMDLDGPVRVLRWRDALAAGADSLTDAEDLALVLEVPFGRGDDHAEAMALLPDGRLLVVYDSPTADRLVGETAVLADLFTLAR